jgi:hypothetical protein
MPQSRLKQPLTDVLGTQANVRLLRALALASSPLTGGELATRAELARTSIYPALRALETTGVVEFVGAGAQRQVRLRERHPLAPALKALFATEAGTFDQLVAALRALLAGAPGAPMSAWIHPAQAGRTGDTLTLYVVARPDQLDAVADDLNARLADVERAHDVQMVVRALSRSDVEDMHRAQRQTGDETILLAGVPPAALVEASRAGAPSSGRHDDRDARARRLALAVAVKIRRDPGLMRVAEDRVRRRMDRASPGERRELMEWLRMLSTMSPSRFRRFLVEDGERATRLRQSLPALGVLSASERDAVIRGRTDADVIAAVTRP